MTNVLTLTPGTFLQSSFDKVGNGRKYEEVELKTRDCEVDSTFYLINAWTLIMNFILVDQLPNTVKSYQVGVYKFSFLVFENRKHTLFC